MTFVLKYFFPQNFPLGGNCKKLRICISCEGNQFECSKQSNFERRTFLSFGLPIVAVGVAVVVDEKRRRRVDLKNRRTSFGAAVFAVQHRQQLVAVTASAKARVAGVTAVTRRDARGGDEYPRLLDFQILKL
jgi:hypothetical protein